jgi:hypothetical protein
MIYAFTGKTNRFICFDCKTNRQREGNVLLSKKDIDAINNCKKSKYIRDLTVCTSINDFIYYEGIFLQISDYINYIAHFNQFAETEELSTKQIEIFRNTNKNADGTSGKATFAHCKQEVMH